MATSKATKKAASTKKTGAVSKKATTKTTTVHAKAPVVKSETVVTKTTVAQKGMLPGNLINIITAEAIGTFVLTLVAVVASAYFVLPLYVGLTLMLMVMAIGAISGAHINPAVTFGLWSMRKLKTALVPFYWAAQFLGAMAAVVLLGAFSGGSFAIQFGHFTEFSWSIFALELVGMAVFMFGIAAVLARTDVKPTGKALGIGMALTIAIVLTTAIVPQIQQAAVNKFQKEQEAIATSGEQQEKVTYPHEFFVDGATLNPAVALAVTEPTETQLQQLQQRGTKGSPADGEAVYTRLSLEVILATLVGAALGGNLFLLVNYRARQS